jgi:hypothetical protein
MRVTLIVLLVSLPLFSACTSESDRVYTEAKKCAAEITRSGNCSGQQGQNANGQQDAPAQNTGLQPPTVKTEQPKSVAIEESRVYLDATESMKGFASSQNNTFTRLIESLSYAMPGGRLYKYGMRKGTKAAEGDAANFASEIRFSQELRSPSFYDLDYNEDDFLFNYLAQEERAVRSVLITDGVYSARQSELQSEVVKAIDKWIKRGRFFGVLIFTSPFEGKLYSENKRTWIDKVNVNARPFYAFVFSPDERGFRELKEKLSPEFGGMQSLVFPRQAIFCQLNPEMKPGLVYKDIWPNTPFYLQMYDETIFGDNNLAELAYEFSCLPAPDYPVKEFGLEVALDAYAWQKDSFKKEESSPPLDYKYPAEAGTGNPTATASPSPGTSPNATITASPTGDPSKPPRLKLLFHKNNGASYSLYHLIFSLSSKALRPEIRARSTEDDSQPGDADKTYRFYEFISALTTIHLQDKQAVKLPPPVFVALTNK